MPDNYETIVESRCPYCNAKNRHSVHVSQFPTSYVVLCEDDDHETCDRYYVLRVKYQPVVETFKVDGMNVLSGLNAD